LAGEAGAFPVLLRGVDAAAFAVALAMRLRSRGVVTGFSAIEDFVRALGVQPIDSRSQLYWTARITLVRHEGDLAVFDQVFAAVFDDAVLRMDPIARREALNNTSAADQSFASLPGDTPHEEAGAGLPWVTLPPAVAEADDSDSPLSLPQRLPADLAALADVPFEQLNEHDMTLLGSWLEAAVRVWPTRRTRRVTPDRRGHRIAMRPTIARSRRTGWEPVELVRASPARRPRRVVMLCDVSQSMQAQSVAYLHLMRALVLSTDAEVFAFATSLTRLTTVLAHRSAPAAFDRANARVSDRFGGTRIATNLQALLASHHGGVVRGAVVIIASDGWDSDPPEKMAVAMARLQRRAHRVIWINPRAAAPGFEPRVATMATALAYCHDLLPADTFASLGRVIAQLPRSASRARVSSTRSRGWTAGTVPR
jgi:uncharacterized protein with von Willebrand factor type A (vWA) domain